LRRCFSNNTYFVNYCNSGTTDAEGVFVVVHLDPFLSLVSATIPYIDLSNNYYRFDVGDVGAGDCGTFLLGIAVSCNAQLGQTHCTEAIIYPDSLCTPLNPMWSGALVQLRSQCTPGDSLRFILKNVGSGDMTESLKYVVIEDHVMLMQATGSPLGVGDSVIVAVPANGSTWRVEAIQASFAPIQSNPVLSVEGCTSSQSFSTGFVNQFPNADEDPWWDIDCTPNIGSFDPNDKQGFPVGVAAAHYIKPGTELEYLIRFQNTGTDTAFNVVIVDTLSAWLDVASLRAGASSHAYEMNIYGAGILRLSFPNILLPDSNTNEPASHGFIRFNIDHKKNAPLETVIENQAAIYFDFNEPIFTNTTFHRLGENFLVSGIFTPKNPDISVQVQPNPSSGEAQIQVKGLERHTPLRLRVYDLQGSLMLDKTSQGPVLQLSEKGWPSGVYLYQLDQDGQSLGAGKLLIK
jgi:uncharacterized repeat protein (TIGR01451 family)